MCKGLLFISFLSLVGINPQVWEQAKKDNPDPKRLNVEHVPNCCCGNAYKNHHGIGF